MVNPGTDPRRTSTAAGSTSSQPDEVLVNDTGGGGGWGDPFERDPAAVADDVRNGFVSVEAARRDYGVVVDAATFAVDEAATAELRAAAPV